MVVSNKIYVAIDVELRRSLMFIETSYPKEESPARAKLGVSPLQEKHSETIHTYKHFAPTPLWDGGK